MAMASASRSDKTGTAVTLTVVEKLRKVFHMLDPDNASLSKTDKERHQEVNDSLDFFVQCSRRISDYYHNSNPFGIKVNFSNIVPRFMQLLRESVLSHQLPEALQLVQAMCFEVHGTDSAIWKVGLACLYQDREKNSRLVEQFVKQVHWLQTLAVVEVLLDYLLFLLRQSNTEDAKSLIQELKQNTLYANHLNNNRRTMAQTLFFAYQGLTLYAEWKLAIFKADHEEDETEIISQLLSQGSAGRAAKAIAEEAIEYLVTVKDTPGVWDIFITPLTEIYEYYGKTEECHDILMSYRDRNPRNPNAHRYVYKFECDYSGDETVILQCLQDIVKLDPCNPLCLNLFNLKEKNDPSVVSVLFDYLDYHHCREQEEVWKTLADRVSNIDCTQLEEAVRECWKTRRDWWPDVIFKDLESLCYPNEQSELSALLLNKQLVQKALYSLDKPCKKKKRIRDVSGSEHESRPTAKKWKT